MQEAPDLVAVVERRLDFLERLVTEPLRKHELVDALDHSRSTVNRAIDELEAAGLVASETDGYRTTLVGRLLARSYRRFLTVSADVDAASDALDPLDSTIDLSPVALRDAETYRAAAPDPYRPLERLDDALVDADTVAAALPALPYPRLLDRCRRTATAGGTVALALTEGTYRLARDRYGDAIAGLARRDGVSIEAVDGVDVGILVANKTMILLVFDDDGGLHGIAESDHPDAIEWGRDRVASLADDGHDVTAELASLDAARTDRTGLIDGDTARRSPDADADSPRNSPGDDADAPQRSPGGDGFDRFGGRSDDERQRLNPLAAQGFVALTDERLERDADPTGPLCASPSFAEVDAGYVVERTVADDGGRTSIVDRLIDGLAGEADHALAGEADRALVGPAGCGKSTVCRTVAVRWHRSGRGPVLYRASDARESFTATDRLRERVTDATGHALIVVEDAVDPEAADVFSVARELSERDDVSVLFDARAETYDSPASLPLSPADLTYRRAVETVRMPPLDEWEVERFADHVAEVTGALPAVDPASLLDDIRRSDEERAGELLCLVHHLVRASDPPDDTARGATHSGEASETPTTSLEHAVDDAVRDLLDRPEPTADVAVLVNLLNVAGVRDVRTLAYALAGEDTHAVGRNVARKKADPGPTDLDRPDRNGSSERTTVGDRWGTRAPSTEAVRRSLDRLAGTVLIPALDGSTRTVHEEWSVVFLDRVLDREPDPVVARRVGRALTRVLALADEPAGRSRVRRAVGGDAPAVDRIERDPETWAAETTRALFGVGRRYPRLAALYGRVRYSWIDLPSACPDALRDRPPEWISRMYIDAGDLDGALDALDAWRPRSEAGEAERQRGFGDVARRRGEYDTARDHFDRAAALFERADDRHGLARAVRGRAQGAHFAGDYETAYEAASKAYALASENDDPIGVAKGLMDVANALDALDGTGAVIDHYRVAGALFRAYDDTHGAANVRANLAVTHRRRGNLSAAKRAGQRALDGYRTVGDKHRETVVLLNLGVVAEQRGEVDAAAARAREGRAIADQIGSASHRGLALNNLGSAAHAAGEFDRAERRLLDAIDEFEALGVDPRVASTATVLAEVAVDRGDRADAERWLDRAETLLGDHAGRRRVADLERVRGRLALVCGDIDAAEAALSTALEESRGGGFSFIEAQTLAACGTVAIEQEDADTAVERLTAAIDLGTRIEAAQAIVAAADGMASLLTTHDVTESLGVGGVDGADGVGPIPDDRTTNPAAYRALADQWRVDGDGTPVGRTATE